MPHDVIVVGSGAAGLTAAVVLGQHGLDVLVIEKASVLGGSTAWSLGALWIPNNMQAQTEQHDSVEAAHTYLKAVLGRYYDEVAIKAFIDSGAEMARYMNEKTDVSLFSVPVPDYYPELKGARIGRSMCVAGMNGSVLGPYLKTIRRPLRGFVGFKTMQVEPWHSDSLKNAFRTWAGFSFTTKRVSTYLVDLVRFGTGAYLANGNALVGRLVQSALKAGVSLRLSTQAISLETGDDAVVGVRVSRGGTESTLVARHAVILASGGFGMNADLTKAHMPLADFHISVQPPENTGDGIAMALAVGGRLATDNIDNATWTPVSVLRDQKNNIIAKFPHFGGDRAKPGSLIVDSEGKRFVNEAAPYQAFVQAMHNARLSKVFLIGDSDFLREWGMGLAVAGPLSVRELIRAGYLIRASSIEAMAVKIQIDPVQLGLTIKRFNEQAQRGVDLEFHRGENDHDRFQGDPRNGPSPNLRALKNGPFYAVALHPGDAGTALGIVTSIDSEVLKSDGSPVRNLYAVGLDRNSAVRGAYPGGGTGIGTAMTFAYRAALHIAARHTSVVPRTDP